MRSIALVVILALCPSPLLAALISVPADYPTIFEGVGAAVSGDIVEVAPGQYYDCTHLPEGYSAPYYCVIMKSGVTLRGATGDPADVVIDAEGIGKGIACGTDGNGVSDVVIEGVSIVNGCCSQGNAITVSEHSSVSIYNCIFAFNQGNYGGAVSAQFDCTLIVTGCLFDRNNSVLGAGLYLFGGGGWISTATVSNCTFTRNSATAGGWDAAGGGAFVYGSGLHASFANCLFAFNAQGAAIGTDPSSPVGQLSVTCTDIFGNAGGDWVNIVAGQAGVSGNLSADPEFCDLIGSGDFALRSDSPCAPGNHPDGWDCGLIGALDVGCEAVSAEAASWSRVKSLY